MMNNNRLRAENSVKSRVPHLTLPLNFADVPNWPSRDRREKDNFDMIVYHEYLNDSFLNYFLHYILDTIY